jgi:RHS repeat-associated protein
MRRLLLLLLLAALPLAAQDAPSYGAFRIEVALSPDVIVHFPEGAIPIAIESERVPGVLAAQTPEPLPRAHLRRYAPDGSPDPRAVQLQLRPAIPASLLEQNRHQRGANRFLSDWIVALGDPRASGEFAWPEKLDKASVGCHNCDWPEHVGKDQKVFEIAPAGSRLRVRIDLSAEQLDNASPYVQHLAERLEHEVETIRSDLVRVATDPLAARNPPTDGFRMAQNAMLHTREIVFSDTDLAVRARNTANALVRVYSSAVTHLGPFGRSFDSPWFARVRRLPDGAVELYDGSGRRDRFTPIAGTSLFNSPPSVFLDLRTRPRGGHVLLGRSNAIMEFDEWGRLTLIADPNVSKSDYSDGNVTRFLYDDASRLRHVVDPIGRAIVIDYYEKAGDGAFPGLISRVTDPAGRAVRYRYDTLGRLIEVSGPDPGSSASKTPRTRYEWSTPAGDFGHRLHTSGRIEREIDGEDRVVWKVAYDAAQPWAAAAIESGGGTWTIAAEGAVRTVTDPVGVAIAYTHDASGRVIAIADVTEATRTYEFDDEGRLLASTEPLGERIEYSYTTDAPEPRHRGNVASATRKPRPGSEEAEAGEGRTTTWDYDARGQVISVTQPDGSKQTIGRDDRGRPAAVTDASGVTTAYFYDDHGLLREVDDPRSGKTTLDYEDGDPAKLGFLKRIVNEDDVTTLVTDERGNVVQATDAMGRTASFHYNALDQLEREVRADSESRMSWDATGAVAESRIKASIGSDGEPVWQVSSSKVDEVGRLLSTTREGVTTSWSYDAAGNTTATIAPGAPPTTYAYDALGRIAALAIGPRVTTYEYDANGASLAVTDVLGRKTRFLQDGFGASVGTIDASGITTIDRHDAGGRPVDSRVIKTLPDGTKLLLRWTVREFDQAGRLVREIRKLFTEPLKIPPDGGDPAGATDVVTTTIYDDTARRITQLDPLGRATVTEMDTRGRVHRMIDPAGNEMRFEYDKAGNRTAEVLIEAQVAEALSQVAEAFSFDRQDASSRTEPSRTRRTQFLQDAQNRLIAVINLADPDRPITTRYQYDMRGQLVLVIDTEGRETAFEYDLRGRRTAIIDAIGAETRMEWDDADRLVALIDPLGNRTEWIWDGNGRLAEERRADGAAWIYAYDAHGNLTSMTDPNGTVSTYARDSLDRITGITIARAEGVEGASSISYQLDDLGRVVAATTDEGVVVGVKLDSLDRPLRETLQIGDGPERVVERAFDLAGQPIGLRYPSGLQIARGFDGLGRLVEIRDAGTALIARWKDVGMRQLEREGGNGVVQRWSWDARQRLSGIESTPPCGIAARCDPMQTIQYARTPAGAKSEVMRPDLELRRSYRLDRLDRIVEEAREVWPAGVLASRMRWELDGALNVKERKREDPPSFVTQTATAEINERNQITSFGGEAFTWDATGNLRARDQLELRYDFANRLARGRRADGTEVTILRDPFGRRVRETLSFAGSARVTDFVLDGDRIVEEWSRKSIPASQSKKSIPAFQSRKSIPAFQSRKSIPAFQSRKSIPAFQTGSESFPAFALSARHIHGRALDELLRAERDTNLDGTLDQVLWPLQDELGTVDALTDSSGQLLARLDYAPWGEPLTMLPGPLADWRFLFQGREWNSHLRAYDFRNRHLIPDLARFAQEDPVGTDHANPYQTMLGNWTTNTDPDGRVVVMQHGIQDDGWNGDWAKAMAESLVNAWFVKDLDPGQDVINVTSVKGGRGTYKCPPEAFCVQDAGMAVVGTLNYETRLAGARLRLHFQLLRTALDASDTRKGEPINVLAHSHGTAMLLAAARQNDTPRVFSLGAVALVGSDLYPFMNIDQLLLSAKSVRNFYSGDDSVVNGKVVRAAGGVGFQRVNPEYWPSRRGSRGPHLPKYVLRPDLGTKFVQTEIRGIGHSLAHNYKGWSWVDGQLALGYLGRELGLDRPRSVPENSEWRNGYKTLRDWIGIWKQVPLSDYYYQPYPLQSSPPQ